MEADERLVAVGCELQTLTAVPKDSGLKQGRGERTDVNVVKCAARERLALLFGLLLCGPSCI